MLYVPGASLGKPKEVFDVPNHDSPTSSPIVCGQWEDGEFIFIFLPKVAATTVSEEFPAS